MTDKKRPSFQFYPSDFISDINVAVMSNSQRGGYIMLLSYAWTQKNRLPKDRDYIKSLSRLEEDEIDLVLKCFKTRGEFFYHPRLEKELEKQNEYALRQKENGRRGGRPKKKDEKKVSEKPTNTPEKKGSGSFGETQTKAKKSSSSSTPSSTSVNNTISNEIVSPAEEKIKIVKHTAEDIRLAEKFYEMKSDYYSDNEKEKTARIEKWADEIRIIREDKKRYECTPRGLELIIDWLATEGTRDATFWNSCTHSPGALKKKSKDGIYRIKTIGKLVRKDLQTIEEATNPVIHD